MQDPQEGVSVIDKSLSTEIDWHVFGFFSAHHLARCARVCRSWNALSNEQQFWLKLLERENVAFDRTKPAKLAYRKLMKLKAYQFGDFDYLCSSDVEAARMVFSNQTLFNKLTPDQVALKIFAFGYQVLEVAFSLHVVTPSNKSRMVMHAEEHQETAEFILQRPELWHLLDGLDLVKIGIYPRVAEKILQTQALAHKLLPVHRTDLQATIELHSWLPTYIQSTRSIG